VFEQDSRQLNNKKKSYKNPSKHNYCYNQNNPNKILSEPNIPFQLVCFSLEKFRLLIDFSSLFLSLQKLFVPVIEKVHVLFHDLLNGL
jgi:hypothetical protein